MDLPQLNDYAIDLAAKGYGWQKDKEIADVNLEHAKYFHKHPDERPPQWTGIKACGMFMRSAFADGARWYREELQRRNSLKEANSRRTT